MDLLESNKYAVYAEVQFTNMCTIHFQFITKHAACNLIVRYTFCNTVED